jgi:hypothetical protein
MVRYNTKYLALQPTAGHQENPALGKARVWGLENKCTSATSLSFLVLFVCLGRNYFVPQCQGDTSRLTTKYYSYYPYLAA